MRTKRLATAAAGAALLVGLSACNNDAEPAADSSSAAGVSSSPGESQSSAGAADQTGEVSGGYDAQELLAAMKSAVVKAETAHLTLDLSQAGQSMTADGVVSYAGKGTAMQLELRAPQLGGTMEIRLLGSTMYMSMPPVTPQGKFFKLDTTDTNSPLGDLSSFTGGDPLATFDGFEAGLEKVRYLGEEDVDGESLHHYVLTVNAKAAAQAQEQPVPKGVKTVNYDLWIDGDDLMRRIDFNLSDAEMTMRMDEWGEPVTVAAPPKSAIVKLPTLPSAQP